MRNSYFFNFILFIHLFFFFVYLLSFFFFFDKARVFRILEAKLIKKNWSQFSIRWPIVSHKKVSNLAQRK